MGMATVTSRVVVLAIARCPVVSISTAVSSAGLVSPVSSPLGLTSFGPLVRSRPRELTGKLILPAKLQN
jgi:hypothetical protein